MCGSGDEAMAESAGVAPTWRSSFPAMGTRVDIIGWGGDGMAIVNAVVGVVARHEDMWSVFRPSSEVSRLNDAVASTGGGGGASRCGADSAQAGHGLVVSEETDRLLRDALALAEATGGAFNPLIGPLVAAWDVKAMRAAYVAGVPLPPAPAADAVEAALRASSWGLLLRVGERRWVMGECGDAETQSGTPEVHACDCGAGQGHHDGGACARAIDADVRSTDAGASVARSYSPAAALRPRVDLGGIAKGYTADACRDLAVAMGARGVLVSVGTSSVSVFGTRADGTSWRAGLRDPQGGPTSVAGVVELPVGGMASLSTSGDNLGPLGVLAPEVVGRAAGSVSDPRARETWRETSPGGGRVFDHHIIDPRTGYPAHAGVRQVSVVASSGVLAEALSTALLVDPTIDVPDVVARWARETGAPASAKVVGLVGAAQG